MSQNKTDDLFDEEFGDLLGGSTAVPSNPIVATPVAPATQPVQAPTVTPTTRPVREPGEVNDGFVSFGTKVASVPIERFKASKDSKARIAILSKQVLTVKTHYIKGIGSIVCMDDKCCELEGLPRVRYIIPVILYETNKSGAVISDKLELKALTLGAEQYDALADAIAFSGRDIQDVDVIVTCSDEQYQKLTFAADVSKGAQWKTYPEAKAIVDKYRADKGKLYMAVARKISMESYLSKKGFVAPTMPPLDPSTNIDDVVD